MKNKYRYYKNSVFTLSGHQGIKVTKCSVIRIPIKQITRSNIIILRTLKTRRIFTINNIINIFGLDKLSIWVHEVALYLVCLNVPIVNLWQEYRNLVKSNIIFSQNIKIKTTIRIKLTLINIYYGNNEIKVIWNHRSTLFL